MWSSEVDVVIFVLFLLYFCLFIEIESYYVALADPYRPAYP